MSIAYTFSDVKSFIGYGSCNSIYFKAANIIKSQGVITAKRF